MGVILVRSLGPTYICSVDCTHGKPVVLWARKLVQGRVETMVKKWFSSHASFALTEVDKVVQG
jgi:hypothetical protein